MLADGRLALSKMGSGRLTHKRDNHRHETGHHVATTKEGTKVTIYVDGRAFHTPDILASFEFNSPAAIGARWRQ
jgi:hypothetical protein